MGSDEVAVSEALLAAQPQEVLRRLNGEGLVVLVAARDTGGGTVDPASTVVALIIFDPPPETVYRMLSQTARQIEYREGLDEIETVKWEDDGPIDAHRMKILFRRYEYHLDYDLDPEARTIRWGLAEDYENDLAQVSGVWELHPMAPDRTLARFSTSVEVAPSVPGFLQDWITAKSVPVTLGNTRRWVNSGGTYRP